MKQEEVVFVNDQQEDKQFKIQLDDGQNMVQVKARSKSPLQQKSKTSFIHLQGLQIAPNYSRGQSPLNRGSVFSPMNNLHLQANQFSSTHANIQYYSSFAKKPQKLSSAFKARSLIGVEIYPAHTNSKQHNSTEASTNQLFQSNNYLSPYMQENPNSHKMAFNINGSKKPPNIPSLKQKIQQAALQLPQQRAKGGSNMKGRSPSQSSKNLKINLQGRDSQNNFKRAQTFLSQATLSIATMEDLIDGKDQQELINYRLCEDKIAQNEFVNMQNPYMFQRISTNGAQYARENMRKRIIFSNVEELDSCTSEDNLAKRIQYRLKMPFELWKSELSKSNTTRKLQI